MKIYNTLQPLPAFRLSRCPLVPSGGSDTLPRRFRYRPSTINMRSSAFICGLVSTRLLTNEGNTDDTDLKDLHGYEIRANPRHPRNPCSTSASFFVDAPEIRNAVYPQFAQTTNLRSSMPKPCGFSTPRTRMPRRAYVDTPSRGVTLGAFICGSFFAEAPYSKDSDRINRMDRINPSINPVNPVQSGSSFSAAPDINCLVFIKFRTSQNSRR